MAEARDKAAQAKAKQDQDLVSYRQQTEEAARKAAQDKKERMLAAARMDLQKQKLTAKADLLSEARPSRMVRWRRSRRIQRARSTPSTGGSRRPRAGPSGTSRPTR